MGSVLVPFLGNDRFTQLSPVRTLDSLWCLIATRMSAAQQAHAVRPLRARDPCAFGAILCTRLRRPMRHSLNSEEWSEKEEVHFTSYLSIPRSSHSLLQNCG